ncbi:ATP-binding protein [Escherichia coli]
MAKIRTKARALDMLGRQQIAGIPTALSELFKNAHDAYADNVEVDFFRKENLLILRDDGLGMTTDEFEERWLTIGTSSKLIDDDAINKPAVDSNKAFRPIMGEKGIGRLSIAAIGPQVLVLTRAKRDNELKPLVAAFVNWSLFAIPSLDLDDIEIPIRTIINDECFTKKTLDEMIEQARNNLDSLSHKISKSKVSQINTQLSSFEFDPILWEKKLGGLRLSGDGHGTHFIIMPTEEILIDDISTSDSNKTSEQSSRLEKALLGFTNTMYSDSNPPIIARFRDYLEDGECIDRISESIFFTPQEFNLADHHIEGWFNEFGQFSGTVSVYGEEPIHHVVTWKNNNQLTQCGPFKIKLAYIHGRLRDSRLPMELWAPLKEKTDRYGGLYIYRDGLRILPYGDSDTDFLKIEKRRTLSASEYFFSYRRLFGAIELTKENNASLVEKAGREGFIENKPYKQFKEMLENFFIEIARDFFKDDGDMSELFVETKQRRNEEHDLLSKRSKQTKAKKDRLKKDLYDFFDKLDNDYWNIEINKLINKNEEYFSSTEITDTNIDYVYSKIKEQNDAIIKNLRNSVDIKKPSGVGLTKELSNLWDRYQIERQKILLSLNELKDNVDRKLIELDNKNNDFLNLRKRLEDSLNLQQSYYEKELTKLYNDAKNALKDVQSKANRLISDNKKKHKSELKNISYEFQSTNLNGKDTAYILDVKRNLESKIENTSNEVINEIRKLTDQIAIISDSTTSENLSSAQVTEAIETELEHLRDQQANNAELILLGMALSVVHHEFNGNIRAIRSALRELKAWADRNPKLDIIYQKIRTSFDHLDGYLKTFTPLTRRLSRSKTNITGTAILEFIRDVFDDRLEKEGIELFTTSKFVNQEIVTYTSTIYPVFINLIDNAIYWLGKTTGEKRLILDATETGFVIGDTGPGVSTRDRDIIFDMGFTRKTGGRGMGLFISKECLSRDGFTIRLDDYTPEQGAFFIIEPSEETSE